MNKPIPCLLAAAFFCAAPAFAQYVGPGSSPAVSNVKDVLASAADDTRVELVGRITEKVGQEKYLFSDGTGSIRVEIEAEDFPHVRIDETSQVRLRGEVEKAFLESVEIDVDHLAVL